MPDTKALKKYLFYSPCTNIGDSGFRPVFARAEDFLLIAQFIVHRKSI